MSATDEIRGNAHRARERHEVLLITPDAAEALCDLADAARRRLNTSICDYCYEDDCTGHSGADAAAPFCPCSHACHEAEHEADEAIEAALARLDREDSVMASSDDKVRVNMTSSGPTQLLAGTLPEPNRRQLLAALGHSTNCVAPDHYRQVWQEERDRAERAKRAYEDAEDRAERAEAERDVCREALDGAKETRRRYHEALNKIGYVYTCPTCDADPVEIARAALSADADADAEPPPAFSDHYVAPEERVEPCAHESREESGGWMWCPDCRHGWPADGPFTTEPEPSRAEGDCTCGLHSLENERGRSRDKHPCRACHFGHHLSCEDQRCECCGRGYMESGAAAVHQAYLDTCARLGWPVKPENNVAYDDLSEESKDLDRATARAAIDAALASGGVVDGVDHKLSLESYSAEIDEAAARVHTLEVALRRLLEFVEPQGLCLCHGQGMCAVCQARAALEGGGP